MQTHTTENGVSWQDLGDGVRRRVLSYTPALMLVQVAFDAGARGAVHRHPHTQCTYVLSGRFVFTVDGKETEVCAGDTLAFLPNQSHGTLCEEAGVLLDIFAPMREDFL